MLGSFSLPPGFSVASSSSDPKLAKVDFSPRATTRLFWQLQIGGWLLAVPLFAALVLLFFNEPGTAIGLAVLRQVIGFGLTLGLWAFYRRWPAAQFRLASHLWQICLVCLAAAGADMALTELGQRLFSLSPLPGLLQRGSFFVRLALYLVWSAFYFVIRQEVETHATKRRLARVETENREAELHLLRVQVNPHFLLNALNTIIGEAEHNPAAVIDTTHAVADYLRYSLGQTSHRAALGAELDAMAHYLAVAAAHHSTHGLDWRIDATAEARKALAPTALVQPLVENALKYGFLSSPRPLRLRVTARVTGGVLSITVENTGDWVERAPGAQSRESTGIGLNNVRRRLVLLCGEEAVLAVTHPPGAVRSEMRLPFEAAPPQA